MRTLPTLLEHAWTMKSGRPPKPLEQYDEITLQALLFHWDDAVKEIEDLVSQSEEWMWSEELVQAPNGGWMKIKKPIRKLDYDKPMKTGDAVADEWEAQLARGETPDW